MSSNNLDELRGDYDKCIEKVNDLTSLIKVLSNSQQLENLEEVVIPEQYLTLLANTLYTTNSLAYSYSSFKSMPFPQQFTKVKDYFNKAKNPLQKPPVSSSSGPAVVIDKQAAKRIIERSTNN